MPLELINCCKGEVCSVQECLDHAGTRRNSCAYPYELLSAMYDAHVAHPSQRDPSRISTTTLTGKCLRKEAIQRNEPYVVEPSELWAAFRGTNVHSLLEGNIHPKSYGEVRFHILDMTEVVPGLVLEDGDSASFSGSPDLVDPVAGLLYDYKRTKEVPRFERAWPDHQLQLQLNRWLIDHADKVEVDGDFLDMHDPEVQRDYVPREWQELIVIYIDDKGPKPISVTKSIEVPTKPGAKNDTRKVRVPDIWPNEQVEAFLRKRYPEARQALNAGTAPIPKGFEYASHPLCAYCPVRTECLRRLIEEGA